MGLFDSLQDPSYPDMVKRKPYNPADYPSMRTGGFYNALSQGAQANSGQQAGNFQQAAGPNANQQGMASNMAFQTEQAARNGSAQLQPYDERAKQGLYADSLQDQSKQDDWNRQMYGIQLQQAMQNQQRMGDMAGVLGGAALGAYSQRKGQNNYANMMGQYGMQGNAQTAPWQRRVNPYGPINNSQSQGF
jgi:hypothetical protein